MTDHSDTFRRCLIALDVEAVRALWKHVAPHLEQPKNEQEALVMMHHARTQAESIPERFRLYSHAWLSERGLPSGLPDHLRAKSERLYPRIVEAVGIAVKSLSGDHARASAIQRAMSDAVLECYGDDERDPETIRARMAVARARVERL